MTTPPPIERALCCGTICGRSHPEHGACVAHTHGRGKLRALHAAGYVVAPAALITEVCDDAAAYVIHEYRETEGYPGMQAKKRGAMAPINQLRAAVPKAPAHD